MEIRQLATFLSLVTTRSFTKTAEEVFLTQPAVSHQILELEKELDTQLFIRGSRNRIELTTAGEELVSHARKILNAAQTAKSQVYNVSHGKTGALKILTVHDSQNIVIQCVSAFSKKYPHIFVDVDVVPGAPQIRAINNDEADIYFSFASLLKNYRQLHHRELTRGQFSLVLREDYDGAIDTKDLSSLKNLSLVCTSKTEAPFLVDRVFEICRNRNFEPVNIHWCNSTLALLIALKAGLGFAIYAVTNESEGFKEGLRVIPLEGADASVDHSIGWHKNSSNMALRFFLDEVAALFPLMPICA